MSPSIFVLVVLLVLVVGVGSVVGSIGGVGSGDGEIRVWKIHVCI